MNLYFRLLRLLFRQLFVSKLNQPTDEMQFRFRAWPTDCDFNLHLTSSRYLAFMDLCRIDWFLRAGFTKQIFKQRWKFVVSAQEITYIREIPPLAKFDIKTQLVGWDEKYLYMQHQVIRKQKVHAVAHIRVAGIQGKSTLNMQEVFEKIGHPSELPELPETIVHWKTLLAEKRNAAIKLSKAA